MSTIRQPLNQPLNKVQQIANEIIELDVHLQRLNHAYQLFSYNIHDVDIDLCFIKLIRSIENLTYKLTEQLIRHSHWWNVNSSQYDKIIEVIMPNKELARFKVQYDLNDKIIDVIIYRYIK